MNLLILSLLLVLLVGIGLLMGRKAIHERFVNPTVPAVADLVTGTPKDLTGPPPQPNPLARDQAAVAAAITHKCPECPACPSCPTCEKCQKCEDMSKYIRMDEIPCWNCTLP